MDDERLTEVQEALTTITRLLAAQVGADLNLAPCECRLAWKDPRLAVLSTLQLSPPRVGR